MSSVESLPSQISVKAYCRLHLGFFDLSAQSGHQFGSIGVAVDAFHTALRLASAGRAMAVEPWVARLLQHQLAATDAIGEVSLAVDSHIPRHSGLGSGTQMALAVGAAVQALQGQSLDTHAIARLHGRGGRSGIGIATFAKGGIVIDGGKSPHSSVPPVIARYDFPAEWRFLLIIDQQAEGIHGQREKSAFQQLTPPPASQTHAMASWILLQAMPALVEQDFERFAEALGALQAYNAAYFAPAQGGSYASPAVTQVLESLKSSGFSGLGQTSWGPTGFVLLPGQQAAEQLQQSLEQQYVGSRLSFIVTQAVNHGAEVRPA